MRILATGIFLTATLALSAQTAPEHWVATWAAAQQLYRPPVQRAAPPPAPSPVNPTPAPAPGPQRRFGIPAPLSGLNNQTVRMIARTSIGGRLVRIRLSNALGASAVTIGSAHIALRGKESAIVPGTDRVLTFSGSPNALMYAGQTLISDPVTLDLPPLAHVAVSLFIPGQTSDPANHRFALHTTWISKEGDFTAAPEMADADTRESWYWLAGIDVLAPPSSLALVTFGDSITDGDQSTPETDGDWPSVLGTALQANQATANVAVVNAGISGNRVLGDNGSGLARLWHDALNQPGIKWMSVLEGINDITGSRTLTADSLIAAYRQMIEAAHQSGVKVIGCTITPYGGSRVFTDQGESVRAAVNGWIRTGKAFDAVVDFDAATRDPANPARFRPEVDSPDMLHPANPGYKLMAEAFAAVFTSAASAALPATRR